MCRKRRRMSAGRSCRRARSASCRPNSAVRRARLNGKLLRQSLRRNSPPRWPLGRGGHLPLSFMHGGSMSDTDKTLEIAPARRQGRLHAWRARWFGERDEVADQLTDIARQGSGMARLAHVCASLMLVLFSAGSLVALGGDALISVLDGAQQGHVDLPAAISLGVSTLLVLCMDVAMLYAASMLRLLGMRRAEPKSMRLHRGVMATVAILEAGAYAYMAWRYETPVSIVAWALILSRALAAPLLSVYLAMARPLPVTARDILAQVELASGLGLIRDAVTFAC